MENVTAGRPATVAVAVFVPVVDPVKNFAAAPPLASVLTVAGVAAAATGSDSEGYYHFGHRLAKEISRLHAN